MLDKEWMHLCRLDPAYERGAWNFVRAAGADNDDNHLIICPCKDCRNVDRHLWVDIVDHLVTRGMDEVYKCRKDWYHHGEVYSVSECDSKVNQCNEEIDGLYRAVEYLDKELAGLDEFSEIVEGEDKKEDAFLAKSFNELLETLPEMLPDDNVLHTSLYDVKKFLKSFDMGYQKIHACINDCCLFRKKLKKLDRCPHCNASRFKRMFRSEEMAKTLRWHSTNKSKDGKLRHPVDSVTWDQMSDKYPLFAAEERNLQIGFSTDGFNPFNMKNSQYSCWPVLLVNYNLPPHLCMKKENIMLILLIPGPHQPGNSIDVYLEPLIVDLNYLWNKGEPTYDAFGRSVFTLKAMLLWTISDFPTYGNLAGCKVKGKMGCPLCGKHTDSMWLKFGRKHVYMRYRKGLPPAYRYRVKKAWFDGHAEHGRKSRILSGQDISHILRNYKNSFGNFKESARKRKRTPCVEEEHDSEGLSSDSKEDEEENVDEEELSRLKKRSIFFNLPYWKELPIRHNLDVMHIERNVAASIVSTLLHCGKSKDGLHTRKDLYFPPNFFDIMVHLVIHLGREARLGGPVQFRWMYPFERNPTRPEGCIAESYIAEECVRFCSDFLKKTISVEEKQDRNTEYDSNSIMEGRPISTATSFTLSDMEKKIAHLAVIQNSAVVDTYVEYLLTHNTMTKDSNGWHMVPRQVLGHIQAKQVFYSKESDESGWSVVLRGPSRRYSEEEEEDGDAHIGPLPSTIQMDVQLDEEEYSQNAQPECDGIYV
ncbi:PREDICTED: uncharacterized protein LOC104709653 [Camelina sativa]|uniref:Uncharacterized protein LOC104709653 n=1 Tax=Camelina sativa TaxID=90675 RepID=A0ABM0TD38_CAMSA|nr:PREDICTED: uncharacterized protein LOC104709653 [Camelina sativa]